MYAVRPSWIGSIGAALTLWTLSSVALAAETRSAEDWFREGVEKLSDGKLEEATTAFQFCVDDKPDLKECWFNLGVAWGRRRDFSNEAKAYLKAVELDPTYGRAHFNLGVAFEDLGRPTDALRHYDMAIGYDPTGQDAYLNKAMLLLSEKRYDEAIAGFERAIAVAPDNAEPYYDLAEAVHLKAQQLEEPQRTAWLRRAVSTYQQCIARDPKHHRAYYNIGVVQHRLRDTAAEVAAYRKALELRPGYLPALYNLACALRDKGDKPAAKQAFEVYLAVAGKQPTEARFVEAARKEMQKL
jgi:superkiller protein 3